MTGFNPNDVIVGGSLGFFEHVNINGVFIQHVHVTDDLDNNMQVNGGTFDDSGNLYVALGPAANNVDKIPHDVVWIPDNTGLVSLVAFLDNHAELWKLDLDGNVLSQHTIQTDTGWTHNKWMKVDISCDSKTVYYSDMGKTIFCYDISTNTQLAPFDQLGVSSNYIYGAFKLLPDADGDKLITAKTKNGNGPGPQRAICLGDETYFWTDEIDPTSLYRFIKRNISDGTQVSTFVSSLDNSDTNGPITALACYFNMCESSGPLVWSWSQVIL